MKATNAPNPPAAEPGPAGSAAVTARFAKPQGKVRVPLMRPLLPAAERILPYLQGIDDRRRYTNFGPLLDQLETRLAAQFGTDRENVVCLSSGTDALILALRAYDLAPGTRCALPAWTFAASAAAVSAAGLTPWFVDVDPATWALDPAHVAAAIAASTEPVGAVMAVGPFGAPVDTAAWDAFTERTGVPVVIDAAAGFDSLTQVGRSPAIVSLGATKILGLGEGGLVACSDAARVTRIRRDQHFGFDGTGIVRTRGHNAKLSEYACAIGLVALDEWPERRASYVERLARYRRGLAAVPGLAAEPIGTGRYVSSTLNVDLGRPVAGETMQQLAARGIEARRWWGEGCHRHPAFVDCPRQPVPASERLAASVLGLPLFVDITDAQIDEVCAALAETLSAKAAE